MACTKGNEETRVAGMERMRGRRGAIELKLCLPKIHMLNLNAQCEVTARWGVGERRDRFCHVRTQ